MEIVVPPQPGTVPATLADVPQEEEPGERILQLDSQLQEALRLLKSPEEMRQILKKATAQRAARQVATQSASATTEANE